MKTIKHGIPSCFSVAQINTYLQRIGFPQTKVDATVPAPNFASLELLVRLHLVAFPFENSRLHYAADHYVDVNTDAVYKRLVDNQQGGSWCCGQNGLFLNILRGLGYRAYAAPARVKMSPTGSTEERFSVLAHLVLLVQLDSDSTGSIGPSATRAPHATYLVDVGYGGNGIVRPIRIEAGHTVPGSAPPEEHRIARVIFPQSSLEEEGSSREWALQFRCGSYQPDWTVLFIFYDYEHYPEDWVASAQWLSRYPVELFKKNVIAIRHFVLGDDVDSSGGDKGNVKLGRLTMTGKRIDRRIGDQSKTIKECMTENERVQILRDDFGITVEEDEISNILHTAAALPLK